MTFEHYQKNRYKSFHKCVLGLYFNKSVNFFIQYTKRQNISSWKKLSYLNYSISSILLSSYRLIWMKKVIFYESIIVVVLLQLFEITRDQAEFFIFCATFDSLENGKKIFLKKVGLQGNMKRALLVFLVTL